MTDPGRPADRLDLDLLREHVEGTLPAAESEALLARAETDARLREVLEAFRDVAGVLGDPVRPAPASRVTLAEVERALARAGADRGRLRGWARGIAAAVLVAASAWAGTLLGGRDAAEPEAAPPTVRLRALAAVPDAGPASRGARAALACASLLANRAAASGGEVPWIDSLEAGRDVAAATGRPILFFLWHPVCPICAEIEATPLRDPAVRERIGAFVPVRIVASFDAPDPDLDREWPYFAVMSSEGVVLGELPVPADTSEFVAFLDDQIARRIPATAVPWERVRERARRLADAMGEGGEGSDRSPRRSNALLADLARDPEAGTFADAARLAIADRMRGAYEALRDAAVASATVADPSAARAILQAAVTRHAGTAAEADLVAVLDALVRTGRFPRFEPAPVPR